MKNWQKQAAIVAFFAAFGLSGCAPARLSEAVIYEKKAGRPDQKGVTEISFLLRLRRPATVSETLEIEGRSGQSFKIISVADEKNVLKKAEKGLEKGLFRVRATNDDLKIAGESNLVLLLRVGEKTVRVRPKQATSVLGK